MQQMKYFPAVLLFLTFSACLFAQEPPNNEPADVTPVPNSGASRATASLPPRLTRRTRKPTTTTTQTTRGRSSTTLPPDPPALAEALDESRAQEPANTRRSSTTPLPDSPVQAEALDGSRVQESANSRKSSTTPLPDSQTVAAGSEGSRVQQPATDPTTLASNSEVILTERTTEASRAGDTDLTADTKTTPSVSAKDENKAETKPTTVKRTAKKSSTTPLTTTRSRKKDPSAVDRPGKQKNFIDSLFTTTTTKTTKKHGKVAGGKKGRKKKNEDLSDAIFGLSDFFSNSSTNATLFHAIGVKAKEKAKQKLAVWLGSSGGFFGLVVMSVFSFFKGDKGDKQDADGQGGEGGEGRDGNNFKENLKKLKKLQKAKKGQNPGKSRPKKRFPFGDILALAQKLGISTPVELNAFTELVNDIQDEDSDSQAENPDNLPDDDESLHVTQRSDPMYPEDQITVLSETVSASSNPSRIVADFQAAVSKIPEIPTDLQLELTKRLKLGLAKITVPDGSSAADTANLNADLKSNLSKKLTAGLGSALSGFTGKNNEEDTTWGISSGFKSAIVGSFKKKLGSTIGGGMSGGNDTDSEDEGGGIGGQVKKALFSRLKRTISSPVTGKQNEGDSNDLGGLGVGLKSASLDRLKKSFSGVLNNKMDAVDHSDQISDGLLTVSSTRLKGILPALQKNLVERATSTAANDKGGEAGLSGGLISFVSKQAKKKVQSVMSEESSDDDEPDEEDLISSLKKGLAKRLSAAVESRIKPGADLEKGESSQTANFKLTFYKLLQERLNQMSTGSKKGPVNEVSNLGTSLKHAASQKFVSGVGRMISKTTGLKEDSCPITGLKRAMSNHLEHQQSNKASSSTSTDNRRSKRTVTATQRKPRLDSALSAEMDEGVESETPTSMLSLKSFMPTQLIGFVPVTKSGIDSGISESGDSIAGSSGSPPLLKILNEKKRPTLERTYSQGMTDKSNINTGTMLRPGHAQNCSVGSGTSVVSAARSTPDIRQLSNSIFSFKELENVDSRPESAVRKVKNIDCAQLPGRRYLLSE